MILTKEQRSEFEKITKPLIKYLAENYHPHIKIIVDYSSAEILESSSRVVTDEFIK